MQIFKEKVETLWIIDDQSKLDSLTEEIREEVILLYLSELFRKNKEITRAFYAPLQWFYQRDEDGHPQRVLTFDPQDLPLMVGGQEDSNDVLNDSSTEETGQREKPEYENEVIDMEANQINQILKDAFELKKPDDYAALQYFAKKQSAKDIGKGAYVYPIENGYVLVHGPDHLQRLKTLEGAWISFGVNDYQGKHTALLNEPETREIFEDYLHDHPTYQKVFKEFANRAQQLGKEG